LDARFHACKNAAGNGLMQDGKKAVRIKTTGEKKAGKFTSGENFISISHQGWLKFPLEFSPSSL
jgi:hypothetical protein